MRRPVLCVFDGFISQIEEVHHTITTGEFSDYVSPWDGVTYPGINKEVPPWIKELFHVKLSKIVGAEIEDVATFARLTTKNLPPAPHAIHSDLSMAKFSAMLYLSKEWPVGSGTSFWAHKTEGSTHTEKTNADIARADSHREDAWERYVAVQGAYNRACVFAAGLWHRAEPFGGWGVDVHDGRLVLTCFFNIKEDV